MTIYGYLFLISAFTIIIVLMAYCFRKVMKVKDENIQAPLDIDTEDHHKGSSNGL